MKKYIYYSIPLVLILAVNPLKSQDKFEVAARNSANDLFELLSLPNDAHFPEDIENNILWAESAFSSRGFKTQRLSSTSRPLLLASKSYGRKMQTGLIYLQFDGQPVDSARWDQPSPWIPVWKRKNSERWELVENNPTPNPDDRIFARSASDAKGPVLAFLTAFDLLEKEGIKPTFNYKVIMDFEEEQGSPGLPAAVTNYQDDLQSDFMLILDGPPHFSNVPTLVFGARGIATMTLKTYGPYNPQHSGHYGNYLPNPAESLIRLLASIKDPEGRVVIPGYYEGINMTDEEKEILGKVPDDLMEINRKMGVANAYQVGASLQESIQFPSFNIRGISAGWVEEEVRTVIPDVAIAEIDIRLVPETNPEKLIYLTYEHITKLGYNLIDHEPSNEERRSITNLVSYSHDISYMAFRTSMDLPIVDWLRTGIQNAHGTEPVMLRMHGGSVPIAPFVNTLGIPAILVPTVNPDNNQHSPNENIRWGNYVDGIKTFYYLMKEPMD